MTRKVRLPRNLDELWATLDKTPQAMMYSGGTDLLVRLREKVIDPPALICLERIECLQEIVDEGPAIRIGSGATHTRISTDPLVRDYLPVLSRAAGLLGSPPIRHMGTIGGNICTASPAGDTLPPLYVLEAEVELASAGGSRRMPVADFITGPGKTVLASGEILSGVRVKKADGFQIHHFEKVGLRNALACAVAGLAALVRLSEEGRIEEVRLAWGSVGPTVMRIPPVEEALTGSVLDRESLERAAHIVRQTVRPIDDVRAGAEYRRQVAGNLLFRLLRYAGPSGNR